VSSDEKVQLAATGYDLLFTHAVLWGAGSIAAEAHEGVRLSWTGRMSKVAVLDGIGATQLAVAVRESAKKAGDPDHWVQAGLPHESGRALFSPRIKALPETAAWPPLQEARQAHLDRLGATASHLDLRLLAGLGEPSSWHYERGQPRQDHGASRLEMQPRNQGSEFVGTRMRSLAAAVAARTVEQVEAGLTGALRVDEVGKKDGPDSRSAANLMAPRVTDNALAWTAMWGLACAPVAHRVHQPSRTATHLPWTRESGLGEEVRAGHFVVPLWSGRWTVARLAAVLASRQLAESGGASLGSGPLAATSEQWLLERGVTGLVVLPVHTFGSVSSPERRAMAGHWVRLGPATS